MQRRLLVVDDEEPVRFAVRDYFGTRNTEVDCAATAEQAEVFLEAYHHGVVLLDLRLSDGFEEGWGLIQRIRERFPRSVMIMLTGFGSPKVEERARSLGVTVYLQKPQPLGLVADIVDEVLRSCEYSV
jgi:DNA-binding response OmpR family regulator